MKDTLAIRGMPPSVRKPLVKLGQDLAIARKRRRLSMATLAERAFITRKTLARVERGEAGVSIGIYASVLFVLGMAERLGRLADPQADTLGATLDEEQLPQRIRRRQRPGAAGATGAQ